MFSDFLKTFLEDHTPWGTTVGAFEKPLERKRFSSFLNWVSYDPETQVYLNQDETIGFLWECMPLAFGNLQTLGRLEGLLQVGLPESSVLQILLHADDYLESFTDALQALRIRPNPLVHRSARELVTFLEEGRTGLNKMAGIPVRNFRLIVALKIPQHSAAETSDGWKNFQQSVEEILQGAYLFPRRMPVERLLAWARWLFNGKADKKALFHYDDNLPISGQIICASSRVVDHQTSLQIGERWFRCTTPKNYPRYADFLQTHELFGGIWGIMSDPLQVTTPFLYCVNYVFQREKLKTSLHAKANLTLQQRAAGSFAPSLVRKQEEFIKTVDDLEKGIPFIRVVPSLWVWAEDDQRALESIIRVKSIWEQTGYLMQDDRAILQVMFLASLPFGLYLKGKILETLERDFILDAGAAARTMPVQADFAGGGQPVLTFVGRKGQLITLDLFEKTGGTNYNAMILAASGTGKSFLSNYIGFSYFGAGALIRIVDIGGSYKKLTTMLGARYMEFTPQTKINLNPFTNLVIDDTGETGEDEAGASLKPVEAVVAQMCYSAMESATPTQLEATLISEAVRWAWETEGNDAGADTVYRYLSEFPAHASGVLETLGNKEEIIGTAHLLALYMKNFLSSGPYGRYFNGRSTFDISRDEAVVLELEHLKPQIELFRVVTLQVINAVTADLYLSDRSRKRLVILDEAWQFLGSGGDSAQLRQVIESGYRRARKYGGSFTIISQSLLDLKQFGSIGNVINANSAFKFLLQSADFNEAHRQGLIDYDDFTMKRLNSTQSNAPKYSEIFLDCPFGRGHLRFSIDDFNYYVYTSDPQEVAEIEGYVKEGLTYEQAIDRMVEKYRRPKGG